MPPHPLESTTSPLPASIRIVFRTWRREDEALALQAWGDPRVTRFILAEPYTETQVRERLEQETQRQVTHGMQYWPIFLRVSGDFVGCCGLRPRPSPGVLELGFLLRPKYWGKGLASEAAQAAVAHGFAALGAGALFAGHHPKNDGSRCVLLKLGFRPTHLEFYPPTGLQHPSYLLTREDFQGPTAPRPKFP